jgi:uncharacterized protein YndB with AHSA1/START domain
MSEAPSGQTDTYEVVISRYFDAPPELVYQAFADPDQLAQWYAPLAFHVPRETVSIDLNPGGHWRLTMVNSFDGSQAPINTTFVEVVENQLLVGYELADGIPGVPDGTRFELSIELIPEGDGTRLELRQGPHPEFMRDAAHTGWSQALFKLDALVHTPRHFRTMHNPETAGPNPDPADPTAA